MKAALAIAVREELEYTEDTGPRCDCCRHCICDNPDSVDKPLAHCVLFTNTLGSFVVSPYGRCKQFEIAF